MKELLEKIRKLPESQRKIILWASVIIIALVIFVLYFKNMKLLFPSQGGLQESLKLDELKKDIIKNTQEINLEMPNIGIPTTTNATTE